MSFTVDIVKNIIKRVLSTQFDIDRPLTEIDRKIYRNFSRDEMACQHCGELYISKLLMDRLQFARYIRNNAICVTSGCRCPIHNSSKEVGGSAKSYHIGSVNKKIVSKAADVKFIDGSDLLELIIIFWLVGFRRFGINWKKKFLHVDIGKRATGKFGYIFTY